jgi:hypothetical protein
MIIVARPRILFFLFLVLFIKTSTLSGQTSISGIINHYTKVTHIDPCLNVLQVSDAAAFNPTDRVLIIQMQGAGISTPNDASYGDISAIGNAGNYEINEIRTIAGNSIYLQYELLRSYNPATGSVQLIFIPQYTDAVIVGTLTAQPWNGDTGGVLILEASGTVTMQADIDVSGLGFRGGAASADNAPNSSNCTSSSDNVFNYSSPHIQAGDKGEGIARFIQNQEAGRAKIANGGGGGQSHNTGGGGGANYGHGGRGGDFTNSSGSCICIPNIYCVPNPWGYGGTALSSYNTVGKIFMGGGGGGGQQNNGRGLSGANGGGIVIIKAASLTDNNHRILAHGNSNDIFDPTDSGDGAGGGGGGGSILLEATLSGTLTTDVAGGKGGDTYFPNRRFGPGGGGGGGLVYISGNTAIENAIISGGSHGVARLATPVAHGAANGENGALLTGLTLPIATAPYTIPEDCENLPVELLFFTAQEQAPTIELWWTTGSEKNNAYFVLEKSEDGIHYTSLSQIWGSGTTQTTQLYRSSDSTPSVGYNYYRLKQFDYDGQEYIIGYTVVRHAGSGVLISKAYPIPFADVLHIESEASSPSGDIRISLTDLTGKEVWSKDFAAGHFYTIEPRELSPGIYFLIVNDGQFSEIKKVVKSF